MEESGQSHADKEPLYMSERRLDGSQSRCGLVVKREISAPARTRTSVVQAVASSYLGCA